MIHDGPRAVQRTVERPCRGWCVVLRPGPAQFCGSAGPVLTPDLHHQLICAEDGGWAPASPGPAQLSSCTLGGVKVVTRTLSR